MEFPELKEATVYASHRKYGKALEIYTEVLEGIDQNTHEYPKVLLAYAQVLIQQIIYRAELNYMKMLRFKTQCNEELIEEDLENAWESLEVCRLNFEVLKDEENLALTYKSLGDVLALKNLFEEAIEEYKKALDYVSINIGDVASESISGIENITNKESISLKGDNALISLYKDKIDLIDSIADCYKHMKKYEESIDWIKQLISIYSYLKMEDEVLNCKESIEILKDKKPKAKINEDEFEKKDINHLKR